MNGFSFTTQDSKDGYMKGGEFHPFGNPYLRYDEDTGYIQTLCSDGIWINVYKPNTFPITDSFDGKYISPSYQNDYYLTGVMSQDFELAHTPNSSYGISYTSTNGIKMSTKGNTGKPYWVCTNPICLSKFSQMQWTADTTGYETYNHGVGVALSTEKITDTFNPSNFIHTNESSTSGTTKTVDLSSLSAKNDTLYYLYLYVYPSTSGVSISVTATINKIIFS